MLWIFVKIASQKQFYQISTMYVVWEKKRKCPKLPTVLFHFQILYSGKFFLTAISLGTSTVVEYEFGLNPNSDTQNVAVKWMLNFALNAYFCSVATLKHYIKDKWQNSFTSLSILSLNKSNLSLTLVNSEWPKLYWVLAILSATVLVS